MRFRSAVTIALLFVCSAALAESKSITIFENRKLTVDVPDSWTFDFSTEKETGVQTLMLDQPNGIKLVASFLPDSENTLAKKDAMAALMKQAFSGMLEGAVEKEINVSFADAVDGYEGHTIFTDKKWVGRASLPATEWRYATAAVRRWPGVMAMFTILSNETDSASYKQALGVMRSGIRQVSK